MMRQSSTLIISSLYFLLGANLNSKTQMKHFFTSGQSKFLSKSWCSLEKTMDKIVIRRARERIFNFIPTANIPRPVPDRERNSHGNCLIDNDRGQYSRRLTRGRKCLHTNRQPLQLPARNALIERVAHHRVYDLGKTKARRRKGEGFADGEGTKVQVLFHVRDAARRMPRLEKGVRESVPADLRFSMRRCF